MTQCGLYCVGDRLGCVGFQRSSFVYFFNALRTSFSTPLPSLVGDDEGGIADDLDDMFVVVFPDAVRVYCSAPALQAAAVLPMVRVWEEAVLAAYAPPPRRPWDVDAEEELKIVAFVAAMTERRLERVGFVCEAGAEAMAAVEKWPLVQSFALEGVGPGGFLTMGIEAVNVVSAVVELMGAAFDAHDAAYVVDEVVPRYECALVVLSVCLCLCLRLRLCLHVSGLRLCLHVSVCVRACTRYLGCE